MPKAEGIRTEADFKDPLDEAIVNRAVALFQAEAQGLVISSGDARTELRHAISAKLKAAKPKTAEDVLEATELVNHDDRASWRLSANDAQRFTRLLRDRDVGRDQVMSDQRNKYCGLSVRRDISAIYEAEAARLAVTPLNRPGFRRGSVTWNRPRWAPASQGRSWG